MSKLADNYVGHTSFDKWSTGGVCLLAVAFLFLPFFIGGGPWKFLLVYYLAMCIILLIPLRLYLRTFNNYYLFQEGIEIHLPFKPDQFLYWEEITQIRGSVWSSYLIISNQHETISCRVNSSYTNVDILLSVLQYARPDLFRADRALTLTQSPMPVIFLAAILLQLIIFGMIGVFASLQGILLLILLILCLLIFSALSLLVPYSVTILGNQLIFHYIFRKTKVCASEIDQISKNTRFDFAYEWGEVTIHQKSGNVTLLMFFNLGVSLLYAFLTNWLEAWMMAMLETGSAWDPISLRGHRRLSENAPYRLPAKAVP